MASDTVPAGGGHELRLGPFDLGALSRHRDSLEYGARHGG